LLVCLNIYLPLNAWIGHDNGTATPLSYIGLGFALYFWFLVLTHYLTPKEHRKVYSEIDIANIIITTELMNKEETKH
jgi:hypothetical protein